MIDIAAILALAAPLPLCEIVNTDTARQAEHIFHARIKTRSPEVSAPMHHGLLSEILFNSFVKLSCRIIFILSVKTLKSHRLKTRKPMARRERNRLSFSCRRTHWNPSHFRMSLFTSVKRREFAIDVHSSRLFSYPRMPATVLCYGFCVVGIRFWILFQSLRPPLCLNAQTLSSCRSNCSHNLAV